jgi:hypothetical protein
MNYTKLFGFLEHQNTKIREIFAQWKIASYSKKINFQQQETRDKETEERQTKIWN